MRGLRCVSSPDDPDSVEFPLSTGCTEGRTASRSRRRVRGTRRNRRVRKAAASAGRLERKEDFVEL